MNSENVYFNGINGTTGDYFSHVPNFHELASVILDSEVESRHTRELRVRHERLTKAVMGPVEGVDPKNLAETGWGVIFAADAKPDVQEALRELLNYRKGQAASKKENYYKEYFGKDGYRAQETKLDFLSRHGAGPNPADPENVPYYLLIVGDPNSIPFSFQYQLDVQYAVGRIYFDTPDEYAAYARNVVEGERSSSSQKAVFFGVENSDDAATRLSANQLVMPLTEKISQKFPSWSLQTYLKEQATKEKLSSLFNGQEKHSLLFTASHGMGFSSGDPRQLKHQGALLCQDWPGRVQWGANPIPEKFYLSADDISSSADLVGLIAFHFACYSAGTPNLDDFPRRPFQDANTIAPQAFVASLPKKFLSLSKGGLAAVGHVERAWGYSIMWPQAGRQIQTFDGVLQRLMNGHPLGSAMEYFNQRYAELSTDLLELIKSIRNGKKFDESNLAGIWTANNDARNYMIIGDPAVRLG